MNKTAFCVQEVECHEEALEHYRQDRWRETSDRIPPHQLLHTVPQWRMDETLGLSVRPSHFKRIEKGPHGFVARMTRCRRNASNMPVCVEFMIRITPYCL